MKTLKVKPAGKVAIALGLGIYIAGSAAFAADVKMLIVLINPSQEKTQEKSVRTFLPKEVKEKDVKDSGGLEIDYDNEQAAFFVYKNDVPLAPGETKTFEIVLDDVWLVPDEKIDNFRERTATVLKHLEGTVYYESADVISKTIYGRLDEVRSTQNDPNVSRQQHIAYHRDNLRIMDEILTDIEKLEKMLVAVGGPPNIDLMEKSDINLKAPTSKTTWVIIFAVLTFILILGGAFYLTWQGQVKSVENIFTKQKDEAFSEFKPDEKKPEDKEAP